MHDSDPRVGCGSRKLIGVAAIYFEIDPDIFVHGAGNLDKLAIFLENRRGGMSRFLKLVSHELLETVGILHWLHWSYSSTSDCSSDFFFDQIAHPRNDYTRRFRVTADDIRKLRTSSTLSRYP